jgi:catechol 2,3-dioxygenase-like lactoylglutathione lyase family enzyme
MNVIYVSDMKRSVAFYEALGLKRRQPGEPDPDWNQFLIGDAALALHGDGALEATSRRVELHLLLEPDGALDRLFATAHVHNLDVEGEIRREPFGRVFEVRDPDGQALVFMDQRRT